MESQIELTEEQERIIGRCKEHARNPEVVEWYEYANSTIQSFESILKDGDFRNNDLSPEEYNSLFRDMRIINNRALTRKLYETNGLQEFNAKLRELFYGEDSLAARIEQFWELAGVGPMTLTHFLFMYNPVDYPVVTLPTRSALKLNDSQIQQAKILAPSIFEIDNMDNHYDYTLDLLADFVIFRQFKDLIDLPDFAMLNRVLWQEHSVQVEGEEADVSLTAVSLEKDLRNYIAINPHKLERELTLVQELYNTRDVGEIDILFRDNEGNHVIVETKKGRSSDKVVGQITRYMGWVKQNLESDVRGIIVVSESDRRLEFSVSVIPKIEIRYYRVHFDISEQPFDSENQ